MDLLWTDRRASHVCDISMPDKHDRQIVPISPALALTQCQLIVTECACTSRVHVPNALHRCAYVSVLLWNTFLTLPWEHKMKFSDTLASAACVCRRNSGPKNTFRTVPCRVRLTIYQLYRHLLGLLGIIFTVGHLEVYLAATTCWWMAWMYFLSVTQLRNKSRGRDVT